MGKLQGKPQSWSFPMDISHLSSWEERILKLQQGSLDTFLKLKRDTFKFRSDGHPIHGQELNCAEILLIEHTSVEDEGQNLHHNFCFQALSASLNAHLRLYSSLDTSSS